MTRSSTATPLTQRLALAAIRLGTGAAWIFELSVGLAVALAVATLLVLLDGMSWGTAVLAGLLALVPALLAGGVALHLARALAESQQQREMLMLDDDLTGVSSRRQFLRLAEREWSRCRRYGDDGAMLLIDTDHLKRINDGLGLRCGDAVLLEVTRRVNATLRQSDVLGRFGGAELAVFLPHTDPLGALDAAERIRQQVAGAAFRWEQSHLVVTVSVGVSAVHANQASLDAQIQEAEAALELAKDAGRNCVRAAPIIPRPSGETAPAARS
ncbi:GGDEF domain-containing protein [Ideonella sp. 4Y11]|uniref:diguanylate cyclase n=1 Tax=Ideonella aquatica TaxID=2824119 RepID=A0A940YRL9_9BURK|nr:GGDEF domain-containing protein [Ideonella aquatica]MBQ0961201.1 GGDEF domain-containing protein [Ideonella aquatica]